jgi:hypothetical protein
MVKFTMKQIFGDCRSPKDYASKVSKFAKDRGIPTATVLEAIRQGYGVTLDAEMCRKYAHVNSIDSWQTDSRTHSTVLVFETLMVNL